MAFVADVSEIEHVGKIAVIVVVGYAVNRTATVRIEQRIQVFVVIQFIHFVGVIIVDHVAVHFVHVGCWLMMGSAGLA